MDEVLLKGGEQKLNASLKRWSVFSFLLGLWQIYAGVGPLKALGGYSLLSGFIISIGICGLILPLGLTRRKEWARKLLMLFCYVNAVWVFIGSIILFVGVVGLGSVFAGALPDFSMTLGMFVFAAVPGLAIGYALFRGGEFVRRNRTFFSKGFPCI